MVESVVAYSWSLSLLACDVVMAAEVDVEEDSHDFDFCLYIIYVWFTKMAWLCRLLIWEECYYEPLPCPFPPNIDGTGTSNLSFGGVEGDRVGSLINRMMANNSVNIAGEG